MAQEQTKRARWRRRRRRGGHRAPTRPARSAARSSPRTIDAILDEIDDVLETNAEEFVRSRSSRRAASDRPDRRRAACTVPVSRCIRARHLVVHRLPAPAGAGPAAVASRAAAGHQAGRPRAARHHDRRGDVPRRRGDGRRPARHDGQHHRPARHREGLPRRRVLRRRHRRHRRHRGRDGAAVPDRARALREDRGHHAVAGRQGQPAGRA